MLKLSEMLSPRLRVRRRRLRVPQSTPCRGSSDVRTTAYLPQSALSGITSVDLLQVVASVALVTGAVPNSTEHLYNQTDSPLRQYCEDFLGWYRAVFR